MRRHTWQLIGAVAAMSTLVVLAGCDSAGTGGGSSNGGSSDNPPTLDPASEIPDTPDELTNAGGNNQGADLLQTSSRSFSAVASFMDPPPEAQSVESSNISAQAIRSETRTWTSGDLTVTWTYEELENKHQWTVVWDGSYDVDETTYTYNDWTLMEGHTDKNAYGGEFVLYDQTQPGSSTAAVKWDWCEDSGVYYYAFGVNDGLHFQLATNGSGSEGEFDVYTAGSGFLSCGTAKTSNETFIVGWDSGGGVWIEDPEGSSNSGSWRTPPGVEAPLTTNDDA